MTSAINNPSKWELLPTLLFEPANIVIATEIWHELSIGLMLTYIFSLTVYRLVLSPLAKIPGPKLAALTSWYEIYYDIILPAQYVWKIKEMHTKYGPIVRVTPWEIHISDPTFLDEIYAGASRNRGKYEFQLRTLPVPMSMGGARTHDLHRRRREALNLFFSQKRVVNLESNIKTKGGQLAEVFETHRKARTIVNLYNIYYAFANEYNPLPLPKRNRDSLMAAASSCNIASDKTTISGNPVFRVTFRDPLQR